jgi:hypothetical protein
MGASKTHTDGGESYYTDIDDIDGFHGGINVILRRLVLPMPERQRPAASVGGVTGASAVGMTAKAIRSGALLGLVLLILRLCQK